MMPILLLSLAIPLHAQPDGGKITNGVPDHFHPSVGLFILDGECTATVIGCRTVLTAAHCICGDHLGGVECAARPDLVSPAGKSVFFQHAGSFALSSIAVNPAYNRYTGVSDLAILHLAAPVTKEFWREFQADLARDRPKFPHNIPIKPKSGLEKL